MYGIAHRHVIKAGELKLPANGHGIRYNQRQAFAGFDFSKMVVGNEDYRMHDADWTTGIAVSVEK